jgi:GntR family transcriptional repressor for pyruvate dehydrogenase complex
MILEFLNNNKNSISIHLLGPFQSRMLAFRVVNTVCSYITKKGLKPGDRFPTDIVLSKELGMGIAPVRHAMRTLHQLGAVRRRRKAGTYLVHPNPEHLASHIKFYMDLGTYSPEEIDRARAMVEQGIAAEAARRRTNRDLMGMIDAIETMENADGDLDVVWAADRDFHDVVLGAARNPLASIFSKVIAESFERRAPMEPQRITNRLALAVMLSEHKAILESISAQDPDKAGELMYQHVAFPKPLTAKRNGSSKRSEMVKKRQGDQVSNRSK